VIEARAPARLDPGGRARAIRLAEWPEIAAEAAARRAPHRVVAYLTDLARDPHGFCHRCRVVGEILDVHAYRLDLTMPTRRVLVLGLDALGDDAPARISSPGWRRGVNAPPDVNRL